MLEVTFYKLIGEEDQKIGSLRWDGEKFTKFPYGAEFLQEVLATPLGDPLQKRFLTSKKNPEEWLNSLYKHYKSVYFRASKPSKV